MPATLLRIGRSADIAPNSIRRADVEGRAIAIYNIDGRFYATDDTCTHGESSLSEVGELNGDVIECGRHFGGFHVPSGKAVLPPCSVGLRTYPIVERDGELFIEIE
jgi:nitrite reductase/ring-hydroxylating ferredoxin subunit